MDAVASADNFSYLLLVVGALFVHACYQLSVSVLTYMSAHSLSKKVSAKRLLGLGLSYSLGVIVLTALVLLGLVALVMSDAATAHPSITVLTLVVAPIVSLLTVKVYYRSGKGTQLWLPRPIADYLLERSRKTKRGVEAFALGAVTVIGELPFIVAPLLLVALSIAGRSTGVWFGWSFVYAAAAALPLVFITMYLTSGHSVAHIQRWREQNKRFLQWTSTIALLLLTVYLTLLQIGVLS